MYIKNFAEYLQNKKILDEEKFKQAKMDAKKHQQRLLSYLADNQIISAELLAKFASEFFGLPIIDVSHIKIDEKLQRLFPRDLMSQHSILPIKQNDNYLEIAMFDPENSKAIEIIQFQTGLHIKIVLARYDHLQSLIKKIVTKQRTNSLNYLDAQTDVQENIELEWRDHDDAPLVQFVNTMIDNAIHKKASDIHFEVYEAFCRVRFRQDGILKEVSKIPQKLARQLAARLKIMAKLDISERRVPQDGRFKIKLGDRHIVDARVNSCPVLHGEKIVLRLLDSLSMLRDIHQIGFDDKQQNEFLKNISKPQGMILVTGPTGSGKTVTLYSALQHLNTIEKNISTVEDPVEIILSGINQVNVNVKANLTFARALRAFLRQDPDIIMVGEIRDLETAEIAIKAAQTGHLVLSTLHTNSALEALTRLRNMGIAPYNIASSLLLITAQRLIRKLCPQCKKEHILSGALKKHFGFNEGVQIFKACGCEACSNGYNGRIAIHEILPIDEQLHDLILQEETNTLLRKHIKQKNILTLRQSALEKAAQGLSSLDEINRVINIENYETDE